MKIERKSLDLLECTAIIKILPSLCLCVVTSLNDQMSCAINYNANDEYAFTQQTRKLTINKLNTILLLLILFFYDDTQTSAQFLFKTEKNVVNLRPVLRKNEQYI